MATGRRVQPKKVPTGVAGVVYDTFQGPEVAFKGWWLNPNKTARVPVPIFQHAFYPKETHTPLDIRQHIQKRIVIIPSLEMLHEHGIEADRAFFVNEVLFHKRHIKNWNALRLTLPSFAKSIANRDNITFIFPASDNPSLRAKRKDVLAVYRGNFTPLFLKGSHYTSGRMNFFFTAPKGAAQKFKRSFNFDEAVKEEKQTLVEYYGFNKARKKRRSYGKRPEPISTRQTGTANAVVKQTADKMEHDLLPIAISRLDIDPNSDAGHAMKEFLTDQKTSRDLLRRTAGKTGPSRLIAVKRWVKEVFWPRAKELLKDESIQAAEALGRFAFRLTVAIVTNEIVGKVQTSDWGADKDFIQSFDYEPHMRPGTGLGAGSLSYKLKRNPKQEVEFQREIKESLINAYRSMTGDNINDYFGDLLDIRFNTHSSAKPVSVSLNKQKIEKAVDLNPEAMGKFVVAGTGEFNDRWFEHVKSVIIRKMEEYAKEYYKKGEEPRHGPRLYY